MQASVDRLRVEITTRDCEVPPDERERLQTALSELAGRVRDFADASLSVRVIHHPKAAAYHAEFRLRLPGRLLSADEKAPDLDTALSRGFATLTREVEAYGKRPDESAAAQAERRAALDRDVVAPEDPAVGPVGEAARDGDYRRFRIALAGYEEWLRKRVGRLVQRIPEAQARVSRGLRLGDVVEEVYLQAFEGFADRPTEVRLREWMEGLIEPSIRALLRHPDEESAAASFARTVRQTPPEGG